ncbi:MAG: EF-P lysine aminoacylase EpmA [Wenzhouxiangellaceae bacterium]|nr:EF-P lysine aminoacylase EpmA [Wenzhouxiangellaceae bacterium]
MTRPDRALRQGLNRRAGQIASLRAFLGERGVIEVHTPLITASGITEVHIDSLRLADGRFLRTSPEYHHKQLLADGAGDLFELGPVFRAGEHGPLHREQFLMLEWYRLGWSWRELAAEVVELITALVGARPLRWLAWRELAVQALGFDPLTEPQALARILDPAPPGLDPGQQLDWLFSLRMQPTLVGRQTVIVHDFPACQAALAKIRPGPPDLAERFEVFVDGVELANGYQELTDPIEQRRRFEADNARREQLELSPMPIDDALLAALERGLPECAGVALGVDRLLMLADGRTRLDEIGAEPGRSEQAGSP